MPKNDNMHLIRLYDSLKNNINEETAIRIATKISLSKSSDFEKKYTWAESIIKDLETEFDDEKIKKIRMDCACGPEYGIIEKLKKLYKSANNY